jgi:hypothetical protein
MAANPVRCSSSFVRHSALNQALFLAAACAAARAVFSMQGPLIDYNWTVFRLASESTQLQQVGQLSGLACVLNLLNVCLVLVCRL